MVSISRKSKLLATAAIAFVALPIAAYAATTTMQATGTFYSALTLAPTNMAFSRIDYSSTTTTAGYVKLGANGAATYDGTIWTADASAATAAGTVVVSTGSNGLTVNISCSASATMGDGAGNTLGIDHIEVSSAVSPGAFGTNSSCTGLGSTSTTMLIASGGGTLHLGGEIDGSVHSGTFAGGAYSTATGGTPISVEVLYQ